MPKPAGPRADRVLINQLVSVGGPIWLPKKILRPAAFDGRDKVFFFVNYEEIIEFL
ncbi:MAG: hypothetical protein IPJ07_20385 [Acidobacteria bacterium]|nr:hypothetical protein [Acidobacteriota bacterium]